MKSLLFLFNLILLFIFVFTTSQDSKAGWGDKPAVGQFGQNKLNNQPNNQPNKNRIVPAVYNSSTGTIHIRNENVVFVSKIDGSETPGTLNKNGSFVPFNSPTNRGNANQQNNDNDNLEYTRMQYKQLCNGDCEDIISALEVKDPRVLAGACTAAAEYDLDVNDRLIDLLDNESEIVAQCARKALMVKSFYALNKIKKEKNEKNIFALKPNPINLENFVNKNNLEIGIDYVDFGPIKNDDNLAINDSVLRWKIWFKKNESKLSDIKSKKQKPNVEEDKVKSSK